jgi:HAE1 family hydrophobic/amphiphilic exporter-1
VVGHSLSRKLRYLIIYVLLVGVVGFLFLRLPTAYLPDEDQGILLAQILMPTGTTLEQTQAVADEVQHYYQENEKEAVESCMTIAGMGFSGRSQNNGMVFARLKDWKLRDRVDLRAKAVAGRAMGAFSRIRNAMVFVFPPPAVVELGNARGIDFQLMDRGGLGHTALMNARNQLLGMAAQDKRLVAVRPNGMEDVPEYRIDVDWEKAGALGLPITSIHDTISAAFGSAYVNDFIQGGRSLSHVAQRSGETLCAQYRGQDGAVCLVCIQPLDDRFPPVGALQRLSVHEHLGRAGTAQKFRRGHAGHGRDRLEAAAGDRL